MNSELNPGCERTPSAQEAREQIAALTHRAQALHQAILATKRQIKLNTKQERRSRFVHLYLSSGNAVRRIASSLFGFRWPVVMIFATMLGGMLGAVSLSWIAGFVTAALGAAAGICLVYAPSDSQLALRLQQLPGEIAAFADNVERGREYLARCETALSECQEHLRGWSDYLQRAEQRESGQLRRQQLLRQNWKAMRGTELEQFLEAVFTELGYTVDRKGGAGDQGVDLVVSRDGQRVAVQVKGYVDSVPNTAIQEAFTGMVYHKCDACAVITNSRFTSGGRAVASGVGCALVDENTLPGVVLGEIDFWQLTLAAKMSSHR